MYRPPSQDEVAQRAPQVIKCDEASREVTLLQNVNGKQFGRTYHFDKVFSPDTTQERLYDTAISSIVEEVLQGFNCTIFAYGQTGTGKTHTMTGDLTPGKDISEGAGVIPRAMKQIFAYLNSIGAASEYTVKCCFLELYNEEITDLLAMGNEPPKVRIMEDRSGVVVQGLEEPHVKSSSEIFSLLETGNARRRTAETLLNKQSSRSHSVFIVTVSVREVLAEGEEVIRVGKLYLVDLAGSENVSRSGAIDQRAKEAGNINKSLLTLGRVITALVEGQGHVPYRDSKLTRLLRDSLGGRTKTCIIATIAPTVQCQEETLSTLDYAHRAKNIKNKPEVNQKISKTTHLKELNVEIARLKAELVATREKNGVYLPLSQYEEDKEERRILAAKVEELEEDAAAAKTQLQTARLELVAAREAIAEREYMLEKHRQCEASLVEHAASLTEDLASAAADVAVLFARVDAKNGIEDNNMGVVNDMKRDAVYALAALKDGMSAVITAQLQRFDASSKSLKEAAHRKKEATAALEDRMSELQSKMTNAKAALTDAIQEIAQAGTASLDATNQQHVDYANVAREAAVKAMQEIEGACAALSAAAVEEGAKAADLMDGQKKASGAIQSAVDTVVTTIQHQLEETQQHVLTIKKQAENSLAHQTASVEALEAEFAALARKEQASLVEQVTSLIAGFVEATEGHVKASVASMKKDVHASTKALQGQFGMLIEHSKASIAGMAHNADQVAAVQKNADEQMKESGDGLRSAMEVSRAAHRALETTINAHATTTNGLLAKHEKQFAAMIKKETKNLSVTVDHHLKSTADKMVDIDNAHVALHSEINAGLSADAAMIDGASNDVDAAAKTALDLSESQRKGLDKVSRDISRAVDERYTVDTKRSAVPSTRQRTVPGSDVLMSLVAPPARDMAREYRASKAEGADIDAHGRDDTDGGSGDDTPSDRAVPLRPSNDQNPAVNSAAPTPAAAVVKSGKKRSRPSVEDIDAIVLESPSKVRVNSRRGDRRRGVGRAVVGNADE